MRREQGSGKVVKRLPDTNPTSAAWCAPAAPPAPCFANGTSLVVSQFSGRSVTVTHCKPPALLTKATGPAGTPTDPGDVTDVAAVASHRWFLASSSHLATRRAWFATAAVICSEDSCGFACTQNGAQPPGSPMGSAKGTPHQEA